MEKKDKKTTQYTLFELKTHFIVVIIYATGVG